MQCNLPAAKLLLKRDNWNEITAPFFEMVENQGFEEKTLEEVFGELL